MTWSRVEWIMNYDLFKASVYIDSIRLSLYWPFLVLLSTRATYWELLSNISTQFVHQFIGGNGSDNILVRSRVGQEDFVSVWLFLICPNTGMPLYCYYVYNIYVVLFMCHIGSNPYKFDLIKKNVVSLSWLCGATLLKKNNWFWSKKELH